MAEENSSFYHFPAFQSGQSKRLVLLQVDIEGHSKLSREKRPADVMNMKVELAEALADRLKAEGFGGVGWQGDGGMFALNVSDGVDLVDKTVPAWRAIRHAVENISKRYSQICGSELIPVRSSAHVCQVLVHPDPRYWHSEGLNAFAKAERDLGRRDRFVITGELYRELPQEAKQEFTDLAQSVTVGERSDVYEFSAGVPGDINMDLNIHEMQRIKIESASFRASVQPALQRRTLPALVTQSICIIVDLQKDFAGDRPLAVQDAEKIAELNYSLARDAISAGFEVVVTRDWHPADHFSFKKKWPEHCVAGRDGAEFMPQFGFEDLESKALVIDIGATNQTPDYSPYFHRDLQDFMETRNPEQILVSGIALEYCVLATCLSSLAYSNRVVALQDYIGSAKVDQASIAWGLLTEAGVQLKRGNPFPRTSQA